MKKDGKDYNFVNAIWVNTESYERMGDDLLHVESQR